MQNANDNAIHFYKVSIHGAIGMYGIPVKPEDVDKMSFDELRDCYNTHVAKYDWM